MKKTAFPWAIAVILIVAWAGWHLVGLVLAGLGLGVVYLSSIRFHPRIRHTGWRGCGGSGEHRSALFPWTFRKCPGCNGGRLIRLGAGHMGADHIKAEYERTKQARKQARDGHVWR